MNKSTLNLFNAIQVKGEATNELSLEKTIKHGFILDYKVAAIVNEKLIKEISEVVGISGEKANNAFHKSWETIKESSQEDLMIQQMIHYMTTYGFEELGIFKDSFVYIPAEELSIPEITEEIKLVVIKGLTKEEILEKIIELGSGIALKTETLQDIMKIIETNKYDSTFVDNIKNKELKAQLCDLYGIVPSNPSEYLRYVVSKVAEESLLIKNNYLIEKIKNCNSTLHRRTLDNLLDKAPTNLAEIFFRYKPIFLALKSISSNKTFFNDLRRKANSMHKPMSEDFLNSVTAKIKIGQRISIILLERELEKVNIFRKIRLAYALKFRTNENNETILYRIRNGKGFVTDFNFNGQKQVEIILDIVLKSIEDELNVEGKNIYIPKSINYALPATEKQFTGNLPTGSYVSVPDNMLVGIHWTDTKKRVDLDLSAISILGKTGWDSYHKSENDGVLFSGDITSAPKPKGAAELFYIKEGMTENKLMCVNYYNFNAGDEVNCKILVAHETPGNFKENYMVDISNILASANINITKSQNVLGLITTVNDENRFYFANVSVGNSITTSNNEQSKQIREYLASSLINSLDFKEILVNAGANILTEKPMKEEEIEYLDLSPEALDKTTIINLLLNKE